MSRLALGMLVAAGLSPLFAANEPPRLVERNAYLMGTRARLFTYAPTREAALTTLETALEVLHETERELSTWRADSEISSLNRQPIGRAWVANVRLCRMFGEVFRWRDETGGAFDPGIGRLLEAWKIHDGGALPTSELLSEARKLSGLPLLAFDGAECTLTRTVDVTVDVGAFGKGEALDRVEAALGRAPWMIDLGGQISVGGEAPPDGGWKVAVADPVNRDRAVMEVRITEGSLSTSGGSERDLVVDGKRVGHILDPKTGMPASFQGSVTVWHRSGLAADALSTALYVMGPDNGPRWAESRDLAVCYFVPDGSRIRIVMTTPFRRLLDAGQLKSEALQRPK